MNIGEFVVKLGFSADTTKLKDFVKGIGDLPLEAAGALIALAGIEVEMSKIAVDAMNAAVGFQMFTNQTGLSWQQLQKWQIVAEQAHVSGDAVASSVEALERNLAAIRLGQGNIAPFQLLGIDAHQNAFGVLEQLRNRIKGLNRATATNLITQMGLSPQMMNVLTLSDKEFEHFGKTVQGMSAAQEQSFLRAKESLIQFGLVAKYVGFDIVGHLIDGFALLVDHIKQLRLWMPGLVITASAMAIAFAPMTAGIVALVLALDDLAVYFEGGDSVIGLAIEGIKKLGVAIKDNLGGLTALGKIATVGSLLANPLGTVGNVVGGAISKVINQSNTINVHSTGSPHEVGKAVKQELDKRTSQASLQTDNQGY